MATVLVTGGAGFIGSNYVRYRLAHSRDNVLVLDKLTYAGNLASLADIADDPRYRFVEGDIVDRGLVQKLFDEHRPAAVVNFAAESHVDRSIDSPRAFIDTNICGAFELLDVSRGYRESDGAPQGFRFLHVSTDEVFGSLGDDGLFREDTPYAPNSPYSASKAAADHLVRAYHHTYGLPTIVTNCSNNYGPYQFPEKLIPLMILNALEGRDLPIYGDGLNVRDWLYVDDHCAGIDLALDRGEVGGSYNIGGHGERSNVDVIDTLCDALERLAPAADNAGLRARNLDRYDKLKSFVPDRKGHDRRYAIDSTRIARDLGWKPQYDFEAGIEATVRWYLDNRDWCTQVQAGGKYGRERLGLENG